MICISCGKQIEDDSLFCEYCGAKQKTPAAPAEPAAPVRNAAPVENAAPVGSAAPVESAPVQRSAPVYSAAQQPAQGPSPVQPMGTAPIAAAEKKPMSPKTKTALIAVAVLAVLVVGAKLILDSLFSPEKTINNFITAIQTEDTEAFCKVTTVAMDQVEMTDEVVNAFFAQYNTPDTLSMLQSGLLDDLAKLKQGVVGTDSALIHLTEKSYVLFSTYAVELTPIQVHLYSEFDNVKLTLANTEYTIGCDGIDVPLLPGAYSGDAVYTDPDTGVKLEMGLENRTVGHGSDSIGIYFDYTYAYVEGAVSAMQVKEIYVDGVQYAGSMDEFDLYSGINLGPVNNDSKIKVVADVYGLDVEQEFDLSTDSYCYMTLEMPAEIEQAAIDIVAEFLPSWMRAVYSYDLTAFHRLTASGAFDSEFLASLEDEVNAAWNSTGDLFYVKFDSLDVNRDMGTVNTYIGDVCSAQVRLPVISNGSFGLITLATNLYLEDSVLEDGQDTCTASLVYLDGRWMITGMSLY